MMKFAMKVDQEDLFAVRIVLEITMHILPVQWKMLKCNE